MNNALFPAKARMFCRARARVRRVMIACSRDNTTQRAKSKSVWRTTRERGARECKCRLLERGAQAVPHRSLDG